MCETVAEEPIGRKSWNLQTIFAERRAFLRFPPLSWDLGGIELMHLNVCHKRS